MRPPNPSVQAASATAFSTAASSVGAWSAGTPPPWARSALPPPRPDSAPLTRSPADRPRPLRGRVDRHDQRRLAAGPGRDRDHRRPGRVDLAADLLRQRAHVVAGGALRRLGADERDAAHVARLRRRARPRRRAPAARAASPAPSPRRAAARPSARPGRRPARLGTRYSSASRDTSRCSRARKPNASMPTSASTRRTPEPIDASVQDLDQAELAGAGDVGAAAQLAGVVADLDDPHLVAVLLAEQRHRADPARLGLRGDERVHLEVAQQHLVDLLLDVVQHRRRHRRRGC